MVYACNRKTFLNDTLLCREIEGLRPLLACLMENFSKNLSNLPVLYGDDISHRIQTFYPSIRNSRSGNETLRTGVHTSIITGVNERGQIYSFYNTGPRHLGENLDKILSLRSETGLPILMWDKSSCNTVTVTNVISGGCLQHAQSRFYKAKSSYPEETEKILKMFQKLFHLEKNTHQLDADARCFVLKNKALPILEKIFDTCVAYEKSKIATPADHFGQSLAYFIKHIEAFKVPFQHPGVALNNNLSEWLTYPIVKYKNNSKHYMSEDTAFLGDSLLTLIMSALLNKKNPYSYLKYLFQNTKRILSGEDIPVFPWGTNDVEILQNSWFEFYIPTPPTKNKSA